MPLRLFLVCNDSFKHFPLPHNIYRRFHHYLIRLSALLLGRPNECIAQLQWTLNFAAGLAHSQSNKIISTFLKASISLIVYNSINLLCLYNLQRGLHWVTCTWGWFLLLLFFCSIHQPPSLLWAHIFCHPAFPLRYRGWRNEQEEIAGGGRRV